jgi:peptidoglycan/LPS O-acetylase OafA/YrhL
MVSMKNRLPELDGLRGVAIILVILFHYGWFPAGWVGVQLFFVLSGYLITRILLAEKRGQGFTRYARRFVWRRSVRIFPVYFLYLFVAAGCYLTFGIPHSFKDDWSYLFTYTTNLGRLRASDIGPAFSHLWSLAVEEQFYLLWPVVIYVSKLQSLKYTILATIILSPFARALVYIGLQKAGYSDAQAGAAVYILPLTQFDAFAFGAAICAWELEKFRYSQRLLVCSGLLCVCSGGAVLLYEYFQYKAAFKESLGFQMYLIACNGFLWAYTLLDLLSAAAVICAIQGVRAVRFLRNFVLRRIGMVSYGIYVFHVPVLLATISQTEIVSEKHGFPLFILYACILVVISECSFRYFETPILTLSKPTNSKPEATVT